MEFQEVKIEIYVPINYIIPLRDALNEIGACKIGNYDHCVTVIQVSGYWRPLTGAVPFDGTIGEISHGQECKMEIRCKENYISQAIRVIRKIHPYEEPVFNIIPIINHLYQ